MYNSHFGFSSSPFENNLDQRFLFLSESHKEVISALLYFIKAKKSFAMVCGDVGTGKTMIVHHLLTKLPPSVQTIRIPFPDIEYIEILRYISQVLKINSKGKRVLELTDEVKAALIQASLEGKQAVVIIDEAHLLSVSSLEHIRLLSNIEITENKLLQILLIGQNELSQKLLRREMRQLRQRININRVLSPMSASETIQYINHRLIIAGSTFFRCFEPACGKLIYDMTGGVPRSINRLCDTALLICMTEKGKKVTGTILKKAHDALHTDVIVAREESRYGRFLGGQKLKLSLAGGTLILLLALGVLGYKGYFGENLRNWLYGPDTLKTVTVPVRAPLPPTPEVKDEEISSPPGAEEKNPSSSLPASGELRPVSPVPESPGVLSERGESAEKVDDDVTKNTTDFPAIKETESNPSASEETQTKNPTPNETRESIQPQGGDPEQEVAAKGGNPSADPQNLRTSERVSGLSDAFTVTVKKGEMLSEIAARWFPEDPTSGEKSILLANPTIVDRNRILVGQILRIPKTAGTDLKKR